MAKIPICDSEEREQWGTTQSSWLKTRKKIPCSFNWYKWRYSWSGRWIAEWSNTASRHFIRWPQGSVFLIYINDIDDAIDEKVHRGRDGASNPRNLPGIIAILSFPIGQNNALLDFPIENINPWFPFPSRKGLCYRNLRSFFTDGIK